jgi:hypothetical protein
MLNRICIGRCEAYGYRRRLFSINSCFNDFFVSFRVIRGHTILLNGPRELVFHLRLTHPRPCEDSGCR